MRRLGLLALFCALAFSAAPSLLSCASGDDDDSAASAGDDQGDDTSPPSDTLTIEGPAFTVTIWKEPFGYQVTSPEKGVVTETLGYGVGDSLFYTRDNHEYAMGTFLGATAIDGGYELSYGTQEGDSARVTVALAGDRTLKVTLGLGHTNGWVSAGQDMQLFDGEAIYGLMERTHWSRQVSERDPREIGGLDRRGEWLPIILLPSFGIYTPFYHSSRGYGLYVDSTFMGDFDAGREADDRLRFRFATTEGRDPVLAYYLFYGPSHDAILDGYTALTGRPFVPPLWTFKHWRWRDEHAPGPGELDGNVVNGQLAEDVLQYEALDFPVGNYMIDRPWTPGPEGFAEFAWDTDRFPNPDAMRRSLADRGYHLIVWGASWAIGWDPGMNGYEADLYGYYAPNSRRHIDFTNPAVFEWWKQKVYAFSRDNDIAGWKLDRGDEDQPSFWWDVYYDGRNGNEMRNAYCVLYQKCYHDAMQEARGDDFVNVFRAGYAGSQAYGIANGGDIRGNPPRETDMGLREAIIMLLHASFMGFPVWGSDTGGYEEFTDREVFARWIEFSCFCPIMEIGGVGNHAPWNMPSEPTYDEEVIGIYRAYTTLHHDLAQYVYDYAQGTHETGRPIARPLVFDYPDDPYVKDVWDEYFFGPDILVAPIWKLGTRERNVYVPAGQFADYWNPDQTITGPTTVSAETPLDRIPIYIRKGATVLGRTW